LECASPLALSLRLLCYLFAAPLLYSPACDATPVSFTNDIAPILWRKCISCHDEKKAKGGLRLQTYAALMAGGKDKEPVLIAGKPEESTMYKLLTATDPDDRMPQKDDPLPKDDIELIRRWIAEGGKFDGTDPSMNIQTFAASLANVLPPAEYPPIAVTALAFNPAADVLASSGYHEVLIWEAQTGRLKQRIQSLPERVHELAYSPDGKWLIAATGTPGRLGQVNLLNAETGKSEAILATASDVFLSVAFNSDATKIAAAGADNSIRVIDLAERKELLKNEKYADWVMAVRFHPNGTNLISASRDKTARVLDAKTGELDSTYQGHTEAIFSVAVNDKGNRVFTAGRDKKVHIWEPQDAKKIGEFSDTEQEIYKLITSQDWLFVGGADKVVRQYQIADKPKLLRSYKAHDDVLYSLALTADGKRLASGSYDGEIRIWNTESGEMLLSFRAAPRGSATASASLQNAH